MIDSERSIKYYIHGQLSKQQNFLQILNDVKALVTVVTEFATARVCDGLGNVDIYLADSVSICKDNMDMYRSTNCTLLAKEKRCNFCVRLKKTLSKKKCRYRKQPKCKRLTELSNPYDQKKMSVLRKKIDTQRRMKNRKKINMQVLLESLRQKRDELVAVKDQLFEEQCLTFNVPEVQKTVLREIIAASKKTDRKGRRYTKDWIMLCMLMNIRSPSYYEFLRKNCIVLLPCTRTVRNYFSLIDSKCGFDEKFFELLKLNF